MKTSETKFESYDAKGTHEYNSWESTFRSEPPPILVSKKSPKRAIFYLTKLSATP